MTDLLRRYFGLPERAATMPPMDAFMKSAQQLFVVERKREWYEELEEEVCSMCPAMTYTQRLWGFIICLATGFLVSMGSLFRLVQLMEGNPEPFAIMYTLGNVVSLCATCFLYGPWAQAKSMFHPTRLVTSCLYFFFMGTTLFLAFYPDYVPQRIILLVFSIFLQFLALTWYSISYIPFARDLVKNCCYNSCCAGCPWAQQSQGYLLA